MALLATTLLAACSKVPDGILSEKKMQGVLTDMLLAEAMVNVDYNTYKSDTMKLALYESVFRKLCIRDSRLPMSRISGKPIRLLSGSADKRKRND